MNARARMLMVGTLTVLFVLSLGWFVYTNVQAGSQGADLVISTLLLAVPLALLYFSIGLMIEAWQERRHGGLREGTARALYYTPRYAGVAVALFTGLFALDVFGQGTLLEQVGAFLIHAAPAIFMLIVVVVAWRWAWVGALAFGLAALFFLRFVIGNGGMGFGNLLLFVLPMAAVAGLFWMGWRWRGEVSSGRSESPQPG